MTKQELLDFICDTLNIPECSKLILTQIHKYVTEHRYNYLEIARALCYFVNIKNQKPQLQYGIGIVPYIMEEARAYFAKLEQQKQEQIEAAKVKPEVEVIKVTFTNEHKIRRPFIRIDKL